MSTQWPRIFVTTVVGSAMLAMAVVSPASASDLVARSTTAETLRVNARGVARIDYKRGSRSSCVLYRGAINADMARPTRYDEEVSINCP